jgi:peptidoglycan/LPS O-acetylase OafA/YrhL
MTAIDPTARGAPVFPPAISGGKVKGKAEIRALTGARGMAALLVVIYHFYPSDQMVPAALGHIIGKGYLWVDLFFVLSGFVLALNYAHLFAGAWGLRQWGDFLLRRLGRIYPLYIVLTLATLIVTVALFGRISGEGLPPGTAVLAHPLRDITANVLLVQSWGIARSVNGPGWSISTEWAAYILFPLLAALALFSRTWLAFLTMAGACLLIGAASWLNATDGAFHAGALDA